MRRLERDITGLNPIRAYTAAERSFANYLFTPLISLDHGFQPSPGIAASWQISDDHLVYRFALNSATFSDGTRVRASDVLFTLRKITDPASESYIADSFTHLDLARTRVMDDETIEVTFRQVLATQLKRFADVYVLPEHVYGEGDFRDDFNEHAIGSGPYRLVRRVPGQRIELERREDYWKEQPPIRRVLFTVIADPTAAWEALAAGDIDETFLPSDVWQRERTNPRNDQLAFGSSYTPSYNFIAWNCRHPLLQDQRVRSALGMAVPVSAIIDDIYHGTARAITGPFTPDEDAYNTTVPPVAYAPDRARRLLAAAGWSDENNDGVLEKDGRRFEISLLIMPGANTAQFASLIQTEFRRIGVYLTIDSIDASAAISRILEGNYDAAYLAWDLELDSDLYSTFHSSQTPPHGQNIVFYASTDVDRLTEAARTEFDPSQRHHLQHRLHAMLAADQPYTWIVQPSAKWAVNRRVQNAYVRTVAGSRLWYPGAFGWWIDSRPDSAQPLARASTHAAQPRAAGPQSIATPSWLETLSTSLEKNRKRPWFWLLATAGTGVGTYIVGLAAILLLTWTRGSRFIARSRLRKAAVAPLRVLPAFARWVLMLGYRRRLLNHASARTAATYYGLPAALDNGAEIVADLTGDQLHATVASHVAPQRPLFIIGAGGSGKSTLLARLVHLGITRRLPGHLHDYVPVLVDASEYSGDLVVAIATALRDRAGVDVSDDRESVVDWLQSGQFLILFDGLSEVFGDVREAQREILRTAGSAALRTCCVIVATRKTAGNLLDTPLLQLQPLRPPIIERLLDHYQLTVSAKNRLRSQMASFGDRDIEPLLFTMMLEASGQTEIARSRSELYERYFRMQLKVHSYDEWLGWCDALETLAERFVLPTARQGFGLTHAQTIDFLDGHADGAEGRESIATRLRRMYHLEVGDALGILNSLANARILVRDRRIRFAHDTFEEYFVARAIVSRHTEDTWVPPVWFSNPRYKRELVELARFIDEMTDENPLHDALAVVRRKSVFATPHKHAWRFAETDIDQAMNVDAEIQPFLPAIRPTLERAFVQILADPLASHRTVIRGDVIYIKRLPPVMDGQRAMPALLIAYSVSMRDRVIRLLALSRAADEPLSAANAADQSHVSILRRIVDVTQDQKGRQHDTPEAPSTGRNRADE